MYIGDQEAWYGNDNAPRKKRMKRETAEQKVKRMSRELLRDVLVISGVAGHQNEHGIKRAWQRAFNALLRAEREAAAERVRERLAQYTGDEVLLEITIDHTDTAILGKRKP